VPVLAVDQVAQFVAFPENGVDDRKRHEQPGDQLGPQQERRGGASEPYSADVLVILRLR
jgi:hypothetical protein